MSYTYNNRYLMRDGKPWFPVMGEMHFTRYREEFWEESIRKMKAGGVTIVSTYVFWIHHEEIEGQFDFSGCRNLRKFVQLCEKVGLPVFLRIGPWCHGEVRNGGFPDWLLQKKIPLRCDDRDYLQYVKRYWEEVFAQVDGLCYGQGGPIIGMQMENEYGHVGGLKGEAGEQHMRTLKALAEEIGFDVPLYTATGWGGAVTGGMLPVMGGYCEAPWDASLGELPANENYVFSTQRNDSIVGNDHNICDQLTFHPEDFPYLTVELGGGIQPTDHRRPVPTGEDIGAMSLAKLGSGAAMLGYYMYHGGSNPEGKLTTLQESRATGFPNDLPLVNYDFFAPIRQFGQISDIYKEIKLLAMFLQDFGEDFAQLPEEIEPVGVSAEDVHTLRTSWRHDADHGYLFINNYQRKRVMDTHESVKPVGRCGKPVEFPERTIRSGEFGFYPYHMQLGEAELVYAWNTPLCKLQGKELTYVFYGQDAEGYGWRDENRATILHLSKEQALNAWKVNLQGADYLILCDNYVWEEDGRIKVTGGQATVIQSYPELPEGTEGFVKCGKKGEFSVYERKVFDKSSCIKVTDVSEKMQGSITDGVRKSYEVEIAYSDARDVILTMDYDGNYLAVYDGEELINDHYYTGVPTELSMKYFGFPGKIRVVIQELKQGDPVFLETWPEMVDGKACRLNKVSIRDEYR